MSSYDILTSLTKDTDHEKVFQILFNDLDTLIEWFQSNNIHVMDHITRGMFLQILHNEHLTHWIYYCISIANFTDLIEEIPELTLNSTDVKKFQKRILVNSKGQLRAKNDANFFDPSNGKFWNGVIQVLSKNLSKNTIEEITQDPNFKKIKIKSHKYYLLTQSILTKERLRNYLKLNNILDNSDDEVDSDEEDVENIENIFPQKEAKLILENIIRQYVLKNRNDLENCDKDIVKSQLFEEILYHYNIEDMKAENFICIILILMFLTCFEDSSMKSDKNKIMKKHFQKVLSNLERDTSKGKKIIVENIFRNSRYVPSLFNIEKDIKKEEQVHEYIKLYVNIIYLAFLYRSTKFNIPKLTSKFLNNKSFSQIIEELKPKQVLDDNIIEEIAKSHIINKKYLMF